MRVLVVDDSEINREVVMRILIMDGAVVNLVNDGQAALDWLHANPAAIDVVLMEVQMPIMDGYEATRQLRALPEFVNLPIIALTAGAFKAQQDLAQKAGMNAFVAKPFNVEELIKTIQKLTHCGPEASSETQINNVSEGNSINNDGNDNHVKVQAANILQPLTIPATAETFVTDLPGIAVAQGLSVWKELAAYQKFLGIFAANYADSGDKLGDFYLVKNYDAARALLHKLKGAAGNLDILKQILGSTYPLIFARSGFECFIAVKKHQPALILLDIQMPDMNGYDVCRRLKNDPLTESIPIIFVSSLCDIGDEAAGFECGGVDYIIKPVSPSLVRARVRTHLSLVHATTLERYVKQLEIEQAKTARLSRIHSVLSGTNSAIVRTREPQALFEEACNIAVDQGGFGIAWIGIVNETGKSLSLIASQGVDSNVLATSLYMTWKRW